MHPKLEKAITKTREYIKVARVELIIIAAALFLDLITKIIVVNNIPLHGTVGVIPNFLNWHHTRNPGAAFGSFFGLDHIFVTGERRLHSPARLWPFVLVSIAAAAIAFGVIFLLFKNKKDIKSDEGKRFYIIVGIALAVTAVVLSIFYAVIMQFRYHMMPFFVTMTLVAVCGFAIVMYRYRGKKKAGLFVRVGLALIIGGALGNWFDRIALGYVRDFIQVIYFGQEIFGQTSFPIFNIADSALTVGVVVFAIGYIRGEPKKPEEAAEKKDKEEEQEEFEEIDFRKEVEEDRDNNVAPQSNDTESNEGLNLDDTASQAERKGEPQEVDEAKDENRDEVEE